MDAIKGEMEQGESTSGHEVEYLDLRTSHVRIQGEQHRLLL